jgi:hypothetical protein
MLDPTRKSFQTTSNAKQVNVGFSKKMFEKYEPGKHPDSDNKSIRYGIEYIYYIYI